MRFGSRSHDSEPDKKDAKAKAPRDEVSALLVELADRVDRANLDRLSEGRRTIATAAEALARTVDRVLGAKR